MIYVRPDIATQYALAKDDEPHRPPATPPTRDKTALAADLRERAGILESVAHEQASAGNVTADMLPWPALVNAELRRVGFDGAVVRHNPNGYAAAVSEGETWATAKTVADQRLLEELGWTPRTGGPERMESEPSEYRYSPPAVKRGGIAQRVGR